ncbi:MAG: hypothetical protein IPM54_36510 [Polyangiaceae bacterium]|nr:hypothetical protein [Polyangiaceae bacterium]
MISNTAYAAASVVRHRRTHYAPGMHDSYWDRLVTSDDRIKQIVRRARRVTVLGVKTEARAQQPAVYMPKYLADC